MLFVHTFQIFLVKTKLKNFTTTISPPAGYGTNNVSHMYYNYTHHAKQHLAGVISRTLWWDNKKTLVLLQGFLTQKMKTKINSQLTYLLFQLSPHKIHLQSLYVFPTYHLTNELHNSP